jgi:predicted SpoU family rRNA methylase
MIQTELKSEKVELEKVELSTLSDLSKSTTKIKSFLKRYKTIVKEVEKASELIKQAKKLNDEGYSLSNANVKIGKKFVSEFKELGLPLGDIKNVKEFMENARIRTDLDNLNSRLLKSLPR